MIKNSLFLLLLFSVSITLTAQSVTLLSWNIKDFGQTKNDDEIYRIAQVIRPFDLVAIQEVVAKHPGGAKAVARLADQLNRMGSKWDYKISNPTQSSSGHVSERYAYLWKTSRIKGVKTYLDADSPVEVDREPYLFKIEPKGFTQPIWLVNFHARPYNKQPENEILHFITYPTRYAGLPVILMGDWNLNEVHPVWRPFYQIGYLPVIQNQGTTLKMKCRPDGTYTNHHIDNIYVPGEQLKVIRAGIADFVGDCFTLKSDRSISDHLPVWVEIGEE